MIHELKCKSEFFGCVKSGKKTFEVRKDDRGFCVGDYLALNEIDQEGKYTGDSLLVSISYILRDPEYCKEGFAILGIAKAAFFPKKEPLQSRPQPD